MTRCLCAPCCSSLLCDMLVPGCGCCYCPRPYGFRACHQRWKAERCESPMGEIHFCCGQSLKDLFSCILHRKTSHATCHLNVNLMWVHSGSRHCCCVFHIVAAAQPNHIFLSHKTITKYITVSSLKKKEKKKRFFVGFLVALSQWLLSIKGSQAGFYGRKRPC